jgi:hypothetical protein
VSAKVAVAVVVVGLVAILALSSYGGLAEMGLISQTVPGGSATLGKAATPVPGAFWGVDVRSSDPEPSNAAALLRATPYTVLRYPGGIVGERDDLSTDTIYSYGGGSSHASFGTSAFVQLCEAISCRAIIQLPLEIDSPSTAVKEVQYVEGTLGFHPAYWELGNEPAGWSCYGVAWANWGSACTGGTSPSAFASESLAYAQAVRAVDPSAQFVGLGGTGQGSGQNVRWIQPLEEVAGHYLAAISIHSYVDGSGPAVATLQGFFGGLSSQYALPFVIQQAQSTIAAACATCATEVFVTELGSANGGGSYAQYIGGFDDAVFYAAEITQGLDFGAGNLDEFAWDIGSTGIVDSSGATYAKYTLASDLLSRMGSSEVNASVSGASNVFAAATEGNGATQLLVVNANAAGTSVSLAGSGLPSDASATEYYWSGSGAPSTSTVSPAGSLTMAGPSVALVVASGSSNGTLGKTPPPASTAPAAFLGVPLVYLLSGALIAAGVLVVAFAPAWWKIAALPLLALGVTLTMLNWATTPVYGG